MNDEDPPQRQSVPLGLTSQQWAVAELLEEKQKGKYLLREYYLGALRVLDDSSNPDRVSQAAHSLRELVEKFTWTDEGMDAGSSANLIEMAQEFNAGAPEHKNRHHRKRNQRLTRIEKIVSAFRRHDPMFAQFDGKTQERKEKKLSELWKSLQSITHHGKSSIEELKKQLEILETIILDLLAPVTLQDQKEIQSILERSYRSKDDEGRIFLLIDKKGANYTFFFEEVDNPNWIHALKKKGYLDQRPPKSIMSYLERVSLIDPNLVVDIILGFQDINYANFFRIIVDIAQNIKPLEQSLRLKHLVLQSLQHPPRLKASDCIAGVIECWAGASAEATNAALEIIKEAVAFDPDPEWEEKLDRHRADPSDWGALMLYPKLRVNWYVYDKILKEGVRNLAEMEPACVAAILIDATAEMIRCHNDDDSTIWCNRVHETDGGREDPRKNLVHALTFACEKVYEKPPEFVLALNGKLKKQSQFIFTRIRQHLYTLHPNEQTQPWIQEMILTYENYGKREYHFEMQCMIRSACESIGSGLLDREGKERIFKNILAGPPEEKFSEERKRRLHRMQLRPFASILFGKYADYYQELEILQESPITDDDYMPFSVTGIKTVENISPKSAAEFEKMTDNELLSCLNEWDNVHSDPESFWKNINFSGLAKEFHFFFQGGCPVR